MSSSNFQRAFGILTGISVGEYIRKRRLTLAGVELSSSNQKIIDISLKYTYETPESFTKAFIRFHGLSPSIARESGANLKSFSRLSIKIIIEGGEVMDYRIENKETFDVVAKVKVFSTVDSINKKEIPEFWTECYTNNTINMLYTFTKASKITGNGLLGICNSECCADANTNFEYAIGIESDIKDMPKGFSVLKISAGTWAIFKCVGAMPDAIQIMWKRIYSEFFPQSDYNFVEGIDFEYYPQGDNSKSDYVSEIWIPVIKK